MVPLVDESAFEVPTGVVLFSLEGIFVSVIARDCTKTPWSW